MASIFSRIVAGEIPSYKIAENEDCYAFLDINPLKKGHTLVIPKKEVDRLFELDTASYQSLMLFAKEVADAIAKAIHCDRIGMAVIGLEVPHAHVHLIPLDHMGDINFAKPKLNLTPLEFEAIAKSIATYIS